MEEKDRRFEIAQVMFHAGRIRHFTEIFDFVPKTVVVNRLGMKGDRWNYLVKHLDEFDLKHFFMIAMWVGISERDIMELVMTEFEEARRERLEKEKSRE